MQLGLGWIFVGAYAVENGRSIDIALLRATSLYTGSRIEPSASRVSARRRNFVNALWIENRTRSKIGLRQCTWTFMPRALTEADFRSSSIFDPESVHKIPKSHQTGSHDAAAVA